MPGTVTGVSFDDTHSYTEWGLKLKEIRIEMPEAKTAYVSVPGMNGDLDLTEAQNGGVKYGMRNIEFDFDARNCNYQTWHGLVSRIARAIEGKEKRILIDTDPEYYYIGRCHVETDKTNEVLAQITISANCEPYKLSIKSSDEPWLWDTFSFIDGVIRDTSDITISSPSGWQEVDLEGWPYNETLRIVSNVAMKVRYLNDTFSIYAGDNVMYDIVLYEGTNKLYFQGSGKVTIVHKGGML
jgi:hypothetical protein